MEKGNTKREILNAALDLFSTQGYEATSISQIAEVVGIRKASLYSHFDSKQAILDALVNVVLEEYSKNSLFSKQGQENGPVFPGNCEEVEDIVKRQVSYILHDPFICRARKMLTIEQFRNAKLAFLQTQQNYSDIMQYFSALMKELTERGVLSGGDPEILAAQFCLPITVWINLCDREPNLEEEVTALIERHIRQFFAIYAAGAKQINQ